MLFGRVWDAVLVVVLISEWLVALGLQRDNQIHPFVHCQRAHVYISMFVTNCVKSLLT